MNILLTSVGRRAYMVKYFQEALNGQGEVHVCNSDDKTVAFHYADKYFISPLIYDDKYIPYMVEYCILNNIKIIISLFDMDLLVLAKNREKFEKIGTRLIVSDKTFIEICNDKWKTYNFLKNNGFLTPKTFLTLQQTLNAIDSGDLLYPIIVKPRFGCGSIALSIAENEMALLYLYRKNTRIVNESYLKYESSSTDEKIIFQEYINGQEYGADIINDLNGHYRSVVLRKKLAMRAGETDIAEIVDNEYIENELIRLGKKTCHIGNLDCDVFLEGDKVYILEMNARFGGGYPFSHLAGVNLPLAIINWVYNKDVTKDILTAKIGTKGFKELYLTSEY